MDEMKAIARTFKALGDPTRLKILEFLGGCCQTAAITEDGEVLAQCGPTAGQVCCQVTGADKINSTISHHLKQLQEAGLITVRREGKTMVCCPNPDGFAALVSFLTPYSTGGTTDGCC